MRERTGRGSCTLAGEPFAGPLVVDPHPVLLSGQVDGDEANERVRGQVGGDGPRGAARPSYEGGGDDRGEGAAEHARHLVAEGDPGVTHPRLEELRDKDPGYAVERARPEGPQR